MKTSNLTVSKLTFKLIGCVVPILQHPTGVRRNLSAALPAEAKWSHYSKILVEYFKDNMPCSLQVPPKADVPF